MAFAASQIPGIPLGLYIAAHWGWRLTFTLIALLGLPVLAAITGLIAPMAVI